LWVIDKPLSASRNKTDLKGGRLFSATVKQLMDSTRRVWREKDLRRFILAFLFYNDGIQTILLLAAVFGAQALHMSTKELGLCYLLIQFVAYGGAMACGRWADSWGHKKIVLSTLAVYAGVTIWAIFMKSKIEFWILGVVIGLILGGSQAASRSLFSLFVPAERTGEYYAFFSVVGKASAFMGPLLFGVINQIYGLRAGVASLLFFFLLGGTLLIFVKEPSHQSAPAN
jgi:UMF1 family MFS transporter